MTACERQQSGEVELYFYDELDTDARRGVEHHLHVCGDCRRALEELAIIRSALGTRPAVDVPPRGDWTLFMHRLDQAVEIEDRSTRATAAPWTPSVAVRDRVPPPRYTAYLAMAALLTLVTAGVVYVARTAPRIVPGSDTTGARRVSPNADPSLVATAATGAQTAEAAFVALSEQHFERSKLVVLGIANKDPQHARDGDWAFERGLASSLLSDTRLYRFAAEERGLRRLANVMGDLEIVLLQTAQVDAPDAEQLEQIQRLIHKRDLVTKMEGAGAGS